MLFNCHLSCIDSNLSLWINEYFIYVSCSLISQLIHIINICYFSNMDGNKPFIITKRAGGSLLPPDCEEFNEVIEDKIRFLQSSNIFIIVKKQSIIVCLPILMCQIFILFFPLSYNLLYLCNFMFSDYWRKSILDCQFNLWIFRNQFQIIIRDWKIYVSHLICASNSSCYLFFGLGTHGRICLII